MFPIRHSVSLAAALFGAATLAFAHIEGNKQPTNMPVVTEVGHGMASDPGRIQILGRGLGIVTEVRLDGAVLPILRNTGYTLEIAPGPQDPGFGTLEFFYPRGVLTETISFTPTLTADHRPHVIQLTIDDGEPGGWYALNFSFRRRLAPVQHAGIYYMDWLDMSVTASGIVGTGFFEERTATEVFTHERMELLGKPVFFQSLCASDSGELCYSNAVLVYPAGHPAPHLMSGQM